MTSSYNNQEELIKSIKGIENDSNAIKAKQTKFMDSVKSIVSDFLAFKKLKEFEAAIRVLGWNNNDIYNKLQDEPPDDATIKIIEKAEADAKKDAEAAKKKDAEAAKRKKSDQGDGDDDGDGGRGDGGTIEG